MNADKFLTLARDYGKKHKVDIFSLKPGDQRMEPFMHLLTSAVVSEADEIKNIWAFIDVDDLSTATAELIQSEILSGLSAGKVMYNSPSYCATAEMADAAVCYTKAGALYVLAIWVAAHRYVKSGFDNWLSDAALYVNDMERGAVH